MSDSSSVASLAKGSIAGSSSVKSVSNNPIKKGKIAAVATVGTSFSKAGKSLAGSKLI